MRKCDTLRSTQTPGRGGAHGAHRLPGCQGRPDMQGRRSLRRRAESHLTCPDGARANGHDAAQGVPGERKLERGRPPPHHAGTKPDMRRRRKAA